MSNPYGDAHVQTESEALAHTGSRDGASIYVGRYYDATQDAAPCELHYSGDRHIVVFGPTGSGKGRSFLIPNLLCGLEDQSVIVIDPKGEAVAKTADARRKMGQDVLILNPFNVGGFGSAGFNPLASLDHTPTHFYDDAAAIGEALVRVEGNDPHWSQSAQGLIVALTMWEKQRRKDKATLGNVRQMLTEADEAVPETDDGDKRRQIKGLRRTAATMVAAGGYEIASLASRFTEDTREISSIRSTADTQTRWMLSPPVRADLEKNGIDFRVLRDRPTTVYVVLPAERLRTHSVWLRLVIVSALNALYKTKGRRVVMFVDEMAALGHLAPLEDAFALIRGYDIQVVAIFQDLNQLKELYKERWETFIANAGVVFGFAPNDLTTAEWMSQRCGQTTVVVKGFSQSISDAPGGQNVGTGSNDQQMARRLFLPQELFGLRPRMGLVWFSGAENVARFYAPDYSMIKACRERATG